MVGVAVGARSIKFFVEVVLNCDLVTIEIKEGEDGFHDVKISGFQGFRPPTGFKLSGSGPPF